MKIKKISSFSSISFYFFGLFICTLRTHPFPENLNGKDTFAMCGIIQQLVSEGNFNFITNLLSYLGLAGPSYSLGALSLAASIQLVLNINIEQSILIYTFLIFFLAYSAAFLTGYRFCGDQFGAFFTAVLFITAPTTTQFLGNWNFSTRTLLLTFLPIMLLLIFKYLDEHKSIFLYLFITLSLLSLTFHRSSYFTLFLIASLIILKISNRITQYSFIQTNKTKSFIISIFIFILLYFLPILIGRIIYLEGGEVVEPPSFQIISNNSPIGLFINLAANYAMTFGFLLIMVLVGIYSILVKQFFVKDKHILILFFLALYSFVWVELTYAPLYFIIYLSLLSAKGLNLSLKSFSGFTKHRPSFNLFVIFFVVFLQFSPLFIVVDTSRVVASERITIYTEAEKEELIILSSSVSDQTIDLSNYLNYQSGNISFFSNYYSVEIQVRVYSNIGPREHIYSVQEYETYTTQLDFGKVKSLILGKQVSITEKQGPDYPVLTYSLYYNENPTDEYISKTLEYHIGGDGRYYIFLASSSWNREAWNEKESSFLIELESNNYVVYANTNYEIKYYAV